MKIQAHVQYHEEKSVKKLLLICLLAGAAVTAMEKADTIEELPLYKKIWLLEGYMKGEIAIQDINEKPYVLFTRYYSNRSATHTIARLRDVIVWFLNAKGKMCRTASVDLPVSSILNDETVLQLQLVRYRTYLDCEDLPAMEDVQKKAIRQARENWDEVFLSQGTQALIEQELKNKDIFAARFAPLQSVITKSTHSDIIKESCGPENLPKQSEQNGMCLIS